MANFSFIPGNGDRDPVSDAPDLVRALLEEDPEARAEALGKICDYRFDQSNWYYREAVETVANYYGAQWGLWSQVEGRFISTPEPRNSNEVRIVCNVIKPIVDQATAMLTNEVPRFKPAAAKWAEEDTAAVSAADDFIDFIWHRHELEDLYRLSSRYMFATGTAMVHVCWDPSEGPLTGQSTRVGALRFTLLTNDMVAPDPQSRNPNDGDAIIIREYYSHAAARRRFGVELIDGLRGDVYDADTRHETTAMEDATRSSQLSAGSHRADWSTTESDKRIKIDTIYVRACDEYPVGAVVILANGVLVEEREVNPRYPQGEAESTVGLWPQNPWPVFTIPCDPRENAFWGRGRVLDMIEPQQSFNGVVSKYLQHIALLSNGKVMLPKNLDVEWTDEMGQVIRTGRNVQPGAVGYLQPPALPPEYAAAWDRLKEEMEYEAGVNGSTMGNAAPNVESAVHADALKQQDMGRIGPLKRKQDRVWGAILLYAVQLILRHTDEEYQVKIVGENNLTSLKMLMQADLAAPLDIRILNDQSIPKNPVQRAAVLQTLASTLGQMPDKAGRIQMMRLYNLQDFEPFFEKMDPHQQKAERMVANILLGIPTPIFPADDPLTFKAELDRLALSQEFEVKIEKQKAEFGASIAEQLHKSYWTYYSGRLAPAPVPGQPAGDGPAPAEDQGAGPPASEEPTA